MRLSTAHISAVASQRYCRRRKLEILLACFPKLRTREAEGPWNGTFSLLKFRNRAESRSFEMESSVASTFSVDSSGHRLRTHQNTLQRRPVYSKFKRGSPLSQLEHRITYCLKTILTSNAAAFHSDERTLSVRYHLCNRTFRPHTKDLRTLALVESRKRKSQGAGDLTTDNDIFRTMRGDSNGGLQ